MAANLAPRNVFELSIDSAFIRHIEKLFDKFAADLQVEANTAPAELYAHSSIPNARARCANAFDIALLTHTEMMKVLKEKS